MLCFKAVVELIKMEFNHQSIEAKWRTQWVEKQTYKVSNDAQGKPKFYVLDMFPYPSGAGLHVGHPLGYIASDIYARYKRLEGFNVLHPMGFDAFGLPAEEYALQTGIHPAKSTNDNIKQYRAQLANLGFSFDWSREVVTCEPKYYKWTQWIFTQLYANYFDQASNKAESIASLEETFSKDGNATVKAANSYTEVFTAAQWNSMTALEKQDVLSHYRLAFRQVGYVNWCEALGTVLANDQVIDGVSERGGHPVEQKAMTQWYLRITAYADRLLYGLDNLEWSDALKAMQSNWIGRSEGASVFFDVEGSDEKVEVFTTRPDTIYGATYMVLAPEHDLVKKLCTADQKEAVEAYIKGVKSRTEIERMAEKQVSGAFIGAYAINPFTEKKMPIWIGEYVLAGYGTGAIMAVPSDDDRDHSFATKFGLDIIDVVDKSKYPNATNADKVGVMINSGPLNGLEVKEAITEACRQIESRNIGKAKVNYKMRDANFGRQRYWGEPFPVTYSADGIVSMLPKEALPLTLPDTTDFKPGGEGKSPLSRIASFAQLENGVTRETDTMPAVAGSSWYFLRYMDPHNEEAFASESALKYWQDVDLYVGGAEHAVSHLLYSRFWHKFLFDKGYVPTEEPFKKLINQGMIQGVIESIYLLREKKDGDYHFMCAKMIEKMGIEDAVPMPVHVSFVSDYGTAQSHLNIAGLKSFIKWRPIYGDAYFECDKGTLHKGRWIAKEDAEDSFLLTKSEVGKMSKRYYNVINPDEVIAEHGADVFRMYEMFLGPIEQSKPWDINSISGVSKFLKKYWTLFFSEEKFQLSDEDPTKEELKIFHGTVKKVRQDIERFSFNTCVSAFMECVNNLRKLNCNKRAILEPLNILLAPFAPFVTEEIWKELGHTDSVHISAYPQFEEKYLIEDSISYPICINGKKRALHDFPADTSKQDLEKQALALEVVKEWTEGKDIKKIIVVPNKMINIVVVG